MSGDPHIAFAIAIGRAPPDATKRTHKEVRDVCKALNFGMIYGMSSRGLARRADISVMEAEDLLKRHKSLYPRFWKWTDHNVDKALLGYPLTTRFGWTLCYPVMSGATPAPRTAANYPVQANGAECMRHAAIRSTEAGIAVCCPIHDAFLAEASHNEIVDVEKTLCRIMGDASEAVLGNGYRIEVRADPLDEPKITYWPESYRETRGIELFNTLVAELSRIERMEGEESLESL
jgi:DNA polymerase I-like protein with 3'-5' exonuclease and polymerase domains